VRPTRRELHRHWHWWATVHLRHWIRVAGKVYEAGMLLLTGIAGREEPTARRIHGRERAGVHVVVCAAAIRRSIGTLVVRRAVARSIVLGVSRAPEPLVSTGAG
jgi:hypothetical protein